MNKLAVVLIALCLVGLPLISRAYTETTTGGYVSAEVTPNNPEPNQAVQVRLFSYSENLDSSNIEWQIDSVSQGQGVGRKTFSFPMGKVGVIKEIKAVIRTLDGSTIVKTLSFQTNDIDLLWEADTYTPPFYQGQAMATAGSQVKITALPHILDIHGQEIPSDRLIFNWEIGSRKLPLDSGTGKNFLVINNINSGSTLVTLSVDNLAGETKGEQTLTVGLGQPQIIFYADKPALGVWYEQALAGNYSLSASEITLHAEPYFFPPSDVKSNFSYQWWMNDKNISGSSTNAQEMSFRQNNNTEGTAIIKVLAGNLLSGLRTVSNALNITFTRKSTVF